MDLSKQSVQQCRDAVLNSWKAQLQVITASTVAKQQQQKEKSWLMTKTYRDQFKAHFWKIATTFVISSSNYHKKVQPSHERRNRVFHFMTIHAGHKWLPLQIIWGHLQKKTYWHNLALDYGSIYLWVSRRCCTSGVQKGHPTTNIHLGQEEPFFQTFWLKILPHWVTNCLCPIGLDQHQHLSHSCQSPLKIPPANIGTNAGATDSVSSWWLLGSSFFLLNHFLTRL